MSIARIVPKPAKRRTGSGTKLTNLLWHGTGAARNENARSRSTAFAVAAYVALVVQAFLLFMFLFEPELPYRIPEPPDAALASQQFARILENVADSTLTTGNEVEVLTGGERFYAAELQAIRGARSSINMEAYIFSKGKIADRFVETLSERAAAGVHVNLVMDAVGSFTTTSGYLARLRQAGARTAWYHPLGWRTIARFNNRTHRELIVVDGKAGFIGGAGVGDHWGLNVDGRPPWRDAMYRVEGPVVGQLQSAFAENWLEASGEVLAGEIYFPTLQPVAASAAMVVDSSPSAGQSTRARSLFQLLIASARRSVYITTPYFLPDAPMTAELVRAARERGVDVVIITPGEQTDHELTRSSSRSSYGPLLEAGIRIQEYTATMIHCKSLVVDGLWCVVGSTNMDSRSFGLNDEVNLVMKDSALAERIGEDFKRDLAASRTVTYQQWKDRPLFERAQESLGWLLERQQ